MATMRKRPYNAPRRREQAAETRAAVIETAHRLFLEQGYAATSIRQVARAARVGEQTVYRLFDTKAVLLREVLLAAVSGTPEGSSSADQERFLADLASAPTPHDRLQLIGAWSGAGYERGAADLEMVVFSAAESDPRVRELADSIRELRYRDVSALVEAVAGEPGPPPGITLSDIADYIYATWSSPVFELLVRERGWTTDKFIAWSIRMVERMFLDRAGG
jgi:AcrR family transcriptional regulator